MSLYVCNKKWSEYSTLSEISKRAGGRRRYNAKRQAEAALRRIMIVETIGASVIAIPHGYQTFLANCLKVDRSTICRDIDAILAEWRHLHICDICGKYNNLSLKKRAQIAKRLKRYMPELWANCCVRGFRRREAERKKKRKSAMELLLEQLLENL